MTAIEIVRERLTAQPLRWLVTGSAGFIGSHLVQRLLELDQAVVASIISLPAIGAISTTCARK